MPGKYYLGDPSEALPSKIYIGIWGNLYNFNNGKFNINSVDVAFHNTHNGDNIFKDTKNRSYNIKTGVIGLIHVDLIEDIKSCKKHGHIFNFEKKVNFIYDAGMFYIKSGKKYIHIDTRNLDDYNSDMEDHCENEEGEYISKTICGASDDDSIKDENSDASDVSDDEINDNEKVSFFKKKI